MYWKKGKCNQGDKCRFLHHDKPQSPGRKPDAPAAPETAAAAKDEKPRSPSPARRRPRSRGRSPNKDKPAACCVANPEATLTGVAAAAAESAEDYWEVDFKRKRAIRHRKRYRKELFHPKNDCPISIKRLKDSARVEKVHPVSPFTSVIERDSTQVDDSAVPWIGKTAFYIRDEPAAKVSFKAKPQVIKVEANGLGRNLRCTMKRTTRRPDSKKSYSTNNLRLQSTRGTAWS